jgi:hypothetical protein
LAFSLSLCCFPSSSNYSLSSTFSSFGYEFLNNCWSQPNVNFTDESLLPDNLFFTLALSFDNFLSLFGRYFGVHSTSEDHQKFSSFGREFFTNGWSQPHTEFLEELLMLDNLLFSLTLLLKMIICLYNSGEESQIAGSQKSMGFCVDRQHGNLFYLWESRRQTKLSMGKSSTERFGWWNPQIFLF